MHGYQGSKVLSNPREFNVQNVLLNALNNRTMHQCIYNINAL